MRKVRVVFHGSCWPTNIGNAFLGIGAIHSLKAALGEDGDVFCVGGMSGYLFKREGKLANSLPLQDIIDCDYLVHSGMAMCYEVLMSNLQVYQRYAKRGTKIIFAGVGASRYTDQEVEMVREVMKQFPTYALISRDRYTFEKYGDLAKHSYDGIDNAFFISDCFQPTPLNLPEFDVMNFDSLKEPHIDHGERLVVRTHHGCCPSSLKREYFKHPYTLISDLPSDYLSLYAQAKMTYSDRVHACVPALAFGNSARMYFREGDERNYMFERVGVYGLQKMPVRLNTERIAREKNEQIRFLRTILLDEKDKDPYVGDTSISNNTIVSQSLEGGRRDGKRMALGLHYLNKVRDVRRREGWRGVVISGWEFFKRTSGRIRF